MSESISQSKQEFDDSKYDTHVSVMKAMTNSKVLEECFSKIDIDKNHTLSKDEAEAAIKNESLDARTRSAAKFVAENYRELAKLYMNPFDLRTLFGVTKDQIHSVQNLVNPQEYIQVERSMKQKSDHQLGLAIANATVAGLLIAGTDGLAAPMIMASYGCSAFNGIGSGWNIYNAFQTNNVVKQLPQTRRNFIQSLAQMEY
jgi:hypothetical protein